MRVKVSTSLYNLQQPTKKIDLAVYTNLLHELKIPPHLVSNTHAKTILKEEKIKRQSSRRKEKNGLTIKDVKLLDRLYSKGPASFGSSKRLQDLSKLPMTKVKMYLETKPSFTKYCAQRLIFPRLKVIVNDLNEVWSLDLAHVDKLSKYNSNVKYLLVAVDCLSRYLHVEPLKTKYATETAKAFQYMIKHKKFG